ncbi:tubulin-tyrosine ligase [Pyrenochaeta sp. DS3sAY3a]|nr:tubulin-tyrosine ligase [Pyrenochaeta sp. DS3sAY3a]
MASDTAQSKDKIYALVDYEDAYVQPLILSALEKRLPSGTYELITSLDQLPSPESRLLQFVQYESIDFDRLMEHSSVTLANAYVIRKALIRKHYLSTTIANWITKYPDSALKKHVKPSVEFEVDYAEFLDDALVEAWELHESWARNQTLDEEATEDENAIKRREWWILKPGMSERGQGIRLFSSEEELTSIFEEWDPESDDEEEDEDEDEDDARSDTNPAAKHTPVNDDEKKEGNGIITSQLRHFIAQPYIHPPLLLAPPTQPPTPSALRKFHIRTYVLATGALQVYVYKPMLALFAASPYRPPWDTSLQTDRDEAMRAHLTNTCLQDSGDREGSVGLFWGLPDVLPEQPISSSSTSSPPIHLHAPNPTSPSPSTSSPSQSWKDSIFAQITRTTSAVFEAAARGMSIHFQPLPNAFEIFGLDFMVGIDEASGELNTYLLEVNAFPDFRQTGGELRGLVESLFEGVVDVGVRPFFGVSGGMEGEGERGEVDMVKVLDVDLGRR